MIIDASGLVAGRVASYAAKQALLGETVDVINSEKAVITGSKEYVLKRHEHFRAMGDPHHGPFRPRMAHMILKRAIRGMLPYKRARGAEALRRIKCYIGVPGSLKGKDAVAPEKLRALGVAKLITLEQLSKLLGAK